MDSLFSEHSVVDSLHAFTIVVVIDVAVSLVLEPLSRSRFFLVRLHANFHSFIHRPGGSTLTEHATASVFMTNSAAANFDGRLEEDVLERARMMNECEMKAGESVQTLA